MRLRVQTERKRFGFGHGKLSIHIYSIRGGKTEPFFAPACRGVGWEWSDAMLRTKTTGHALGPGCLLERSERHRIAILDVDTITGHNRIRIGTALGHRVAGDLLELLAIWLGTPPIGRWASGRTTRAQPRQSSHTRRSEKARLPGSPSTGSCGTCCSPMGWLLDGPLVVQVAGVQRLGRFE